MNKREQRYDGLEELRTEVCRQAFLDYKSGVRHRRKCKERIEAILTRKRLGKPITNAEQCQLARYKERMEELNSAEAFFRSDWGESMTGVDGEVMMRMVRGHISE